MLYGCGVLSLHVRRNAGLSFFSKLLKVISHKKYQKNPLGKKLSPLQQSVLNIGAVNAEQTMFYCDSLETGSSDLTWVALIQND